MKNKFNIVALLPIKKKSQRIKNKNFKLFFRKPLFKWVLDKLLKIQAIDLIIINTDYNNIEKKYKFLKNKKILIRKRIKNLCGHKVSMNKIIENDIKHIKSNIYLMTHATNPLLTIKTIKKAIKLFKKNKKFDSLFTVNKIQSRLFNENFKALNHKPNKLVQTQDLKPLYEENSNLYIFSSNSFFKNISRIGKKPFLMPTTMPESIDIDNFDQWNLALKLAKFYK